MTSAIYRKQFFLLFPLLIALQVEGQFHLHPGFKLKNQGIAHKVEQFSKLEALKGASWGLVIRNASDGKILLRKSADENFIPASNMKVLTSLNAFHNLGKDYRFKTEILVDGEIKDGILHGNLLIAGSGDPSPATEGRDKLNAGFFRQLSAVLREKGIREISGTVLAKNPENPYTGIRKDWSWSDVGNYYGAGIYPLNINENQFHHYVEARQEGRMAILKKTDSLSGKTELDEVRLETSPPGSPDLAYYNWIPGTNKIKLTGSIPRDSSPQRIKGAIQDPEALFIEVVRKEIQKSGIILKSEKNNPGEIKKLGEILSPSLPSIAAEVNLNSNNLYTEALAFALCRKGDDCLENGWSHLERFAQTAGFPAGYYLADGSGLSPSNRLSPAGISNALVWALKQSWANAFLQTLPVAGESGTMKNFCKAARGKIRAKSGTLTRTLCYSGYADTEKGKIVFSLMINNYHGPYKQMKENTGALLESFAEIK